jgi:hypothetical protein
MILLSVSFSPVGRGCITFSDNVLTSRLPVLDDVHRLGCQEIVSVHLRFLMIGVEHLIHSLALREFLSLERNILRRASPLF